MQEETLLLIRDLVNEEVQQLMEEGEMPHTAYFRAVRDAASLMEGVTGLRLMRQLDTLNDRKPKESKERARRNSVPNAGTQTREIYDWAATVTPGKTIEVTFATVQEATNWRSQLSRIIKRYLGGWKYHTEIERIGDAGVLYLTREE